METKQMVEKITNTVWQLLARFAVNIKERMPNIIFFGILFAIVGVLLPDYYYKYIDNRAYYTVHSATVSGGVLKPCGYVDVALDQEALFDLQGRAVVEVTLVRADKTGVIAQSSVEQLAIHAGSETNVRTYQLACTLRKGDYFVMASVSYMVRGNQKITTWQSNRFTVN